VEGFHSIVGPVHCVSPTEKNDLFSRVFQEIPAFQMVVMVHLEASTFFGKQTT
jgi:hypothetical protein